MSPSRRLAAFAVPAAFAITAACAGDPTAASPGGARFLTAPTAPTPPPPITTSPSDSVVAGYGNGSTGGLEYHCFEYSPETGTEYVVSSDTAAAQKGLTSTGCSDPER